MAPRSSPEKYRPSIFWLLAAVVVPVVRLMAKIEVEGEENLPAKGPYVLAPNHVSELDPLILAVAVWRLGRAPRFLAKDSLFRVPVVGPALRAAGMVPVSRSASSSASRETIRGAEVLVERGRGIIVYPEGTLTRDPDMWPMRGKSGAVRLALAGRLPVIPVAHWGVQEIMPRYGRLRPWPPRRRVRIVIGEAIDLTESSPESGQKVTPAVLTKATSVVMDRIAALLGRIRGEDPPAERWNPSRHGQNETGQLEP